MYNRWYYHTWKVQITYGINTKNKKQKPKQKTEKTQESYMYDYDTILMVYCSVL